MIVDYDNSNQLFLFKMTNRKKEDKNNKSTLRFVDLAFDQRCQLDSKKHLSVSLDNLSVASEGGYRRHSKKKANPLSQYSFNKSAEHQQQLHDDIDAIIQQEYLDRGATAPRWVFDISKESTHSGESPLFIHKLLAPSRVEQQNNVWNNNTVLPTKPSPALTKTGSYYRPNRTHQYLTNTELKDAASEEVESKLGKPTRTTLLRARQRCNSAPVNAYEKRREIKKKAEEQRNNFQNILNSRGFAALPVPSGETIHSFLIGARYNRAHYLDSKSITEHGVYMPRGNPTACFVIKSPTSRGQHMFDDLDMTPATPPESLESLSECDSEDGASDAGSIPRSPSPPTTPAQNSAMPHRKPAWSDPCSTCKMCQEEQAEVAHSEHEREPQVIMQEVVSLDESLNIKGVGVSNVGPGLPRSRPGSSRPGSARPGSGRPTSARNASYNKLSARSGVLPSVHVQGVSTFTPSPSVKVNSTIDQLQMANQPSPGRHVSTREVSEKLQQENIFLRKLDVGKTPEPLETKPTANMKVESRPTPTGKPKIIKVDKAVNVPSLSGEPSSLGDFVLYGNSSNFIGDAEVVGKEASDSKVNDDDAVSKHKDETQPSGVEISAASSDLKARKHRVRFADQPKGKSPRDPKTGKPSTSLEDKDTVNEANDMDPKFFLTEDSEDNIEAEDAIDIESGGCESKSQEGADDNNGVNDLQQDQDVSETDGKIVEAEQEVQNSEEAATNEEEIDDNSLTVNLSDNQLTSESPLEANMQTATEVMEEEEQTVIMVDIATKPTQSSNDLN